MTAGPDDSRDEALRRLAAEAYHPPPETPREEMWAALAPRLDRGARMGSGAYDLVRRRARLRWAAWAMAASAVLALGVGLGRMTAPGPAEAPSVAVSAEAGAGLRMVASQHLQATESLLAFVQADARAGRFDGEVGQWGRGLLTETRLLLDSEAGRDPVLRELLLDLEVILAQVAVLDGAGPTERGREELRLIARGVDEQGMLARIQSALPAMGTGLSGT